VPCFTSLLRLVAAPPATASVRPIHPAATEQVGYPSATHIRPISPVTAFVPKRDALSCTVRLSEVHQDAIRAAVKILTLENTYIPTRLKDGQQGAAVSSSGRGSRPQQPKSLTSYPTMPQGMRGGGKPMQPRGEGAGGRGYVQTGGGYGGGRGGDRNGDRNRRGAPPPPRAPGEYSNRG
jgi:hypothetical protein